MASRDERKIAVSYFSETGAVMGISNSCNQKSMGVVIRGVKNAFRNVIRTVSVTLILALSIGLALVMLLSYQTVQTKIENVKASMGNVVSVNPAGAMGFEGGGEPLTSANLTTIQGLANIKGASATMQDRLTPGTDTTLTSSIEGGTLGRRFQGGEVRGGGGASVSMVEGSGETRTFTPPIMVTGSTDPSALINDSVKLTEGELFASDSGENVAVIGAALATKNSLSIGSTFTAYGQTITVKGIYDAGNQFANNGVYFPLKTLQTLTTRTDEVSSITATATSIETVDSVVAAIKDALGDDKVDVTSNKQQATDVLTPLENIKSISMYSLIGALAAGAVITLLIMMMIVRERRREIGVLKAIGSSNIGIVGQFISESLVLTLMGSVVGAILGVVLSNPVLTVLVNNSSSAATTTTNVMGGPAGGMLSVSAGAAGGGPRLVQFSNALGGGVRNALENLQATVGWDIILYGFLAAILIAIVGSAIPAWLIAKIKPAEVMRAE